MNLEEELNMINNQTIDGEITQPIYEQSSQMASQSLNTQPVNVQQYAQPSMVNPIAAQQQTDGFNFSNLDSEPNKPLYDRNPIDRLSGNSGEIFRVHFLPGCNTKRIKVHYNPEIPANFVCLGQSYGTNTDECCAKYGDAKPRVIIPVVVMPIIQGQPNALMQGQPGELKSLVLGPKQYSDLLEQAKFAGVDDITRIDIIASVDNPKFKSFKFTICPQSFIQQIPNIAELTDKWNKISTPENVCKLCGRLITRADYNAAYKNVDLAKYSAQDSTPQNGQLNFAQPGYNQPYAQQNYSQQPSYNQQSSYGQTYGPQSQTNNDPWSNFQM